MLVKDARILGRTCLTLGRFSGELVKHRLKDCSRNRENKAAHFRRADFQSWPKFAGKATARQENPRERGWRAVNVRGRNESPAAFQVVPASERSSDVPSSCSTLDWHLFCPLYLEHAPPAPGPSAAAEEAAEGMVGGSRPNPSLPILLGKERSQEGDAVWMPEERS